MLSLTPTMCRSYSGSSLSPSFGTASNNLLAVHNGVRSLPWLANASTFSFSVKLTLEGT